MQIGNKMVAVLMVGSLLTAACESRVSELPWHVKEGDAGVVIMSRQKSTPNVSIRVIDVGGVPIRGLNLDVRGSSGGNPGKTDLNGQCKLSVDGVLIEEIIVDGVLIYQYEGGGNDPPSLEGGVNVLIIIK